MALLVEEVRTGQSEFAVVHPVLMTAAKIGNRTNYFRVLRELSEWGVIVYCSTPQGNSRVSLQAEERSTNIDTAGCYSSINIGTTRRQGSIKNGTTT